MRGVPTTSPDSQSEPRHHQLPLLGVSPGRGGPSVLVTQLCLTLYNPMDYNPPGSSVHGILLARILERFVIPFSRRSSQPRDGTQVTCTAGKLFKV